MVPGGNFTQQLFDPRNEGGITFEMELMATALGLRGLNSFTKLNSFRAPKSKVFNFMSAGQAPLEVT